MIIYLTHAGQFVWWYHAYFRKYRLFTNGGVVEIATLFLYGQNLVELKENWNDCKILLGGDIGSKLSQILSDDVAKTLRCQSNSLDICNFKTFWIFSKIDVMVSEWAYDLTHFTVEMIYGFYTDSNFPPSKKWMYVVHIGSFTHLFFCSLNMSHNYICICFHLHCISECLFYE